MMMRRVLNRCASLGIGSLGRGKSIYSTFVGKKPKHEIGKLSIGYPMTCYEPGCKFPPTAFYLHGFFESVDAYCNLSSRPFRVLGKDKLHPLVELELVNIVFPQFIDRMKRVVYPQSEVGVIEIMLHMWIKHGCKTPYVPVAYYEISLSLYESLGCGGLLDFIWDTIDFLDVGDVDRTRGGCIGVKGEVLRELVLAYFNFSDDMMVEIRSSHKYGFHAFKDILLGFDIVSFELLKETGTLTRMRGSLDWGRKNEFVYLLKRQT